MIHKMMSASSKVLLPSVKRVASKVPARSLASGKDVAKPSEEDKSLEKLVQEWDKKYTVTDEPIHTGQVWDSDDFRMARYLGRAEKKVNPRYAVDLIAEVAPILCEDRVVHCDGGGGPLGHPRVFINLDKPGNHACGYCGLRFYKDDHHHH